MQLTQEMYPVTFNFILNTIFKHVIYRNSNIYWRVMQGWYSGQFCSFQQNNYKLSAIFFSYIKPEQHINTFWGGTFSSKSCLFPLKILVLKSWIAWTGIHQFACMNQALYLLYKFSGLLMSIDPTHCVCT